MLIKKIILFGVVFSFIFSQVSLIFFPKWTSDASRMKTFYKQPPNSIDVIFIGTSTFLRAFPPLFLWDEYGFTSYNRATAVQPPVVTYYYLLETIKYQQPEVVVLDPRWLLFRFDMDEHEAWLRYSIDPMELSIEKVKLINNVVKFSEKQTLISYIFPLFRYHSRWNELKKWDFGEKSHIKYDYQRGFGPLTTTCDCEWQKNYMAPSQTPAELNPDAKYYFQKIIELCGEEKIKIVLVTLPKLRNWDYSKYLAVQKFSEENDVRYLDYNLPEIFESINLDPTTDFYDPTHLNINGAIKVSYHLGDYLNNIYKLPNKKNNPDYKNWNNDLHHFYSISMSDE